MKKILLLFCAMLTCVGMSAKDIYGFVLGDEMTLSAAATSEKGFVLVSGNQVLGIANNGDAGLKMYDVNDVAVAYMVKLESISGVTGVSATEPNAYHVLFYKPNATKVEAGDRYGIWGNPNCALTAVGWGDTWVAPFNGDKPDGRDFDYGSRWNFEAQPGGGYAVYFNEGTGRKYLNGGRISDNLQKVWHLHPITKEKVGHTTFDLTKVSFEDAKNSSNPVVLVQNNLVLCNSNGGANYSTKEDFDEFAYWVKFEDYDASNNQYYITLNKEDGSRVNYLNASIWSHIFLSGVDKAGTRGEKQNGAVFTIAALGENKYSIRDLGAVEGAYGDEYVDKGYVKFTTDGYWKNNATWQHGSVGEWEFYTVTNKQDVLDDHEPSYTISTTVGKIGTIALDYPASIEGATLYEVVGFNTNDGLALAEVEGDMVGGTPYIYQASADQVNCYQTGASVEHGDFDCTKGEVGNGLVGCYSKVSPSDWWFNFIRTNGYVISNGKLRNIANGNVTIPANRCFFDSSKCTNNNSAHVKMFIGWGDEETAIDNVNNALEGGKIYDLNGREVKSMKKGGIYIIGGMKVSVK